jgi:hypothetical protein
MDTVKIVDSTHAILCDIQILFPNVIDSVKNVFIHTEKTPWWRDPFFSGIVGIVIGAFLSLIVEWVKKKVFKPNLLITIIGLEKERIIKEKQEIKSALSGEETRKIDDFALYCHLKISNRSRLAKANNVRIMVTRFQLFFDDAQIPETDIKFENGYIPLRWQWEFIDKDRFQKTPNIGSVKWCDLLRVSKSAERTTAFKLQSAVDIPSTQFHLNLGKQSTARVTIIALSDEIETKPQTFEVTWNGTLPADFDNLKDLNILKDDKYMSFSEVK